MSLSVYVHVPFCRSRCAYCAFYSGEPLGLLEVYPELIAAEAKLRSGARQGPVSTVYLGGGTPSLLTASGVAAILEAVDAGWGLDPRAEVTLEANPVSDPDLTALRAAGVTRLSVGVQCLSDALLSYLGRPHDAAEALATVERAAEAGFASVSADLLFALPGLSPELLRDSARRLREAGAHHVSTYALEIHPGTRLAAAHGTGAFEPCSPEQEEGQWLALDEALGAAGYAPYEVSNYSVPDAHCRHNIAYWEGGPYVGLGPGAHGYDPTAGGWGSRSWNESGLGAYLRALRAGGLPPGGREQLSAEQALMEELFLALRRPAPVAPATLCNRYGLEQEAALLAFRRARDEGFVRELGTHTSLFTPTREGLRRADGLALWFLDRLGRPTSPCRVTAASDAPSR